MKFLPPKKNFYEKFGKHNHLSADIPINAVFSKSGIALKIKMNQKNNYHMKYVSPKQTCMQDLVSIGQ